MTNLNIENYLIQFYENLYISIVQNSKHSFISCLLSLLKDNLLKYKSIIFDDLKIKFNQLDYCFNTNISIEYFEYRFSQMLIYHNLQSNELDEFERDYTYFKDKQLGTNNNLSVCNKMKQRNTFLKPFVLQSLKK